MTTDITTLLNLLLVDAFWAMLTTMGFAILFNVPRRALPYCMLSGAVGHASRALLISALGLNIVAATLIAATLLGFMAHALAQRLKMPALVFSVSGAIPMIPGVLAFRTMLGILSVSSAGPEMAGPILTEAAFNGIQTGLILAALAVGIVTPMLIFHRPRPVV